MAGNIRADYILVDDSLNVKLGNNSVVLSVTANDTFVAANTTQTLTNKTLTAPLFSGNVGIGTAGIVTPSFPLTVVTPASGFALALNGRSTDNLAGIQFFAYNSGTIHARITATASEYKTEAVSNAVQTFHTNSIERMRIDSSGNLQFNSGYGSVATAFGCRAWVNFDGTGTVAIRSSGNVSSITDNGQGDYTVNFTTAMPDANYVAFGSVIGSSNTDYTNGFINGGLNAATGTHTTTAFRFLTVHITAGVTDYNQVQVAVIR